MASQSKHIERLDTFVLENTFNHYEIPFVDICGCLWVLTLLIKTKSTKHNFLSSDNVQGCQKWLLAPKGSIITVLSLSLQSEPEFNAAKRAIHWIWENSVNSGENDQTDKGKKSQKKCPYAVPKLPLPPPLHANFGSFFTWKSRNSFFVEFPK